MDTADFDYALPSSLIAQHPHDQRDESRMLVLDRYNKTWRDRRFPTLLEYLHEGDALVINDSRVIPARLWGTKLPSGGCVEAVLAEENGVNDWWVLLRPAKRVKLGTRIRFQPRAQDASPTVSVTAQVIEKSPKGLCRLQFEATANILNQLGAIGEVPLPPYIVRNEGSDLSSDSERYQTVYARPPGSIAAPTAGLHFTAGMLEQIRHKGIHICPVTLHVGLGTFAPIKSRSVEDHDMHSENYELSETTVERLAEVRRQGRRITAVGTTSVRVLEHVASQHHGQLIPEKGHTQLFIRPPHPFAVVDQLLTNFHLPQSTLLMLVSAFVTPEASDGTKILLKAYAHAVKERYRFFSYGDAMLIL